MQSPPIRHWYGFGLSLLTAVLWGILPIFLKLCLQVMDAVTITWFRFAVAFVIVVLLLWKRNALPSIRAMSGNKLLILLAAAFALLANYVLYVEGLLYINPETAQVVIQLAPFMLMLGGIAFYGERFNKIESAGAVVLLSGFVLFFNERLTILFSSLGDYTYGVVLVFIGAVTWAGYALVQKVLLRSLTAKQLTAVIYLVGTLALLPFSQLNAMFQMTFLQASALIFCCLNTVIAYGAFTEALNVWHASKVSAMIALAPLFTFGGMELAVRIWPQHFSSSELDQWAYIGAGLVMVGSIVASVGKSK